MATLANDNMLWREHAQRLLVERGQQDVLPGLFALVRDTKLDAIGLNVGAIHALWTLQGLGALDGNNADATAVAYQALKHPSAGVRRNAVQVLPRSAESVAALLAAGVLKDSDAQVRLLALLALADQPAAPSAGEAVLAALKNPIDSRDRWIGDAAICAAAKNSEHFLRALAEQKTAGPNVLAAATIVADHYARGGPVDSIGAVISRVGRRRSRGQRSRGPWSSQGVADAKQPHSRPTTRTSYGTPARALAAGTPGLAHQAGDDVGQQAFEKHAAEAAVSLLARVKNEALATGDRLAAARELVGNQLTDAGPVKGLMDLVSPRATPEFVAGVLAAVRISEAESAGSILIERLPMLTPAARAATLSVLLSRPAWTKSLLDAAQAGKLQLSELPLDQKQSLADHPDRTLQRRARELLARGGGLPNPDRQKVLDELMIVTKEKGDAVAGKLVFKNQCMKCHVHGSEGNRIGPDLTGMAVHPKDHLLTDILDPSRSVEGELPGVHADDQVREVPYRHSGRRIAHCHRTVRRRGQEANGFARRDRRIW